LLAILTEDAGHPDFLTNDSFHRCSVCALVVEETFAVMIAELCSDGPYSAGDAERAHNHEQLQSPFAADLFLCSPKR
jgi:hypothetical protein